MTDTKPTPLGRRNSALFAFVTYLLDAHLRVRIQVDARSAFVQVPLYLKQDHQLHLDIFSGATKDLVVNRAGITAELLFNGTPHRIAVPWSAIDAASGGGEACKFQPDASPAVLASERATVPGGRKSRSQSRAKALGIRRIK